MLVLTEGTPHGKWQSLDSLSDVGVRKWVLYTPVAIERQRTWRLTTGFRVPIQFRQTDWKFVPVCVFVKIFRLCPVVTSAQMSTYVGWATWLCGSISAYEMAKLDLHLLCLTEEGVTLSLNPPPLHAWVWPVQVGVGEASMQTSCKARRASRESKPDAG